MPGRRGRRPSVADGYVDVPRDIARHRCICRGWSTRRSRRGQVDAVVGARRAAWSVVVVVRVVVVVDVVELVVVVEVGGGPVLTLSRTSVPFLASERPVVTGRTRCPARSSGWPGSRSTPGTRRLRARTAPAGRAGRRRRHRDLLLSSSSRTSRYATTPPIASTRMITAAIQPAFDFFSGSGWQRCRGDDDREGGRACRRGPEAVEVGGDLLGGVVAAGDVRREEPLDHGVERGRHGRDRRRRRERRPLELVAGDRDRVGAAERWRAGHGLVEQHAEGVEVPGRVGGRALESLRRAVDRRLHRRLGDPGDARGRGTEVGDLDRAVACDQDVARR